MAMTNVTNVLGARLKKVAADASSRLPSRQLKDIESATRTRRVVVCLVENLASLERQLVHEFVHVFKDTFSQDKICC